MQATPAPLWPRWQPAMRAAAMPFSSGSGLYTVVSADTRAFRIGLMDAAGTLDIGTSWQSYYQPAGTDGQALAQLNIVLPDNDQTEIVRQISTMTPGDNIGILVDGDQLLFLRNDEVILSIPRPCNQGKSCPLTAFVIESATAGASPTLLVH
jgi:hypothetical protein